eukprot:gene10448-11541_t
MDVSQKKMLAICIRYYSPSRQSIRTTLLKMLNLGASGTSDTIGAAVRKTLEQAGLCLQKLITIGVDGCGIMIGVNHSVSTYFKALVPEIVQVCMPQFTTGCQQSPRSYANSFWLSCKRVIQLVLAQRKWLLYFRELHKTIKNEVQIRFFN